MRLGTTFTQLFSLDLRALAALRVGLAFLILTDLLNRVRYLTAHYTDQGVFPGAATDQFYQNPFFFSFHSLNGSWEFQAFLFLLAGVFACMLLVGFHTRLATVLSWMLLASLQTHNPLILQGGDILLRLTLFWAIFLPLGARYSVDSIRKPAFLETNIFSSVASAAYILQIAFVYFFTALLKSGSQWVLEGSAVYYTLSIDQLVSPFGNFLLSFPVLLQYLTFSILALEFLAPFLLVAPFKTYQFRLAAALALIAFHVGLATAMHLGPFPWIGIISTLALLPPPFWNFLSRKRIANKKQNLVLYYDGECGFCQRTVQYIKTFFLIPKLQILPASQEESILRDMLRYNSWVVVDRQGKRHYKFDGVTVVVKACPFLWFFAPLLRIPFIFRAGTNIYEYIASHRKTQCFPFSHPSPAPNQTVKSRIAIALSGSIVFALIIYVFLWNLGNMFPSAYFLPPESKNLAYSLRLDQLWNMFSPFPYTDDGWYVVVGTLKNGTTTDLFQKVSPVSWEKPRVVADTYDGERWRKYMMNLWYQALAPYRVYYAQYLCHSWNKTHNSQEQLESVEVTYMLERTLPGFQYSKPQPVSLLQYQCLLPV